MCRFVCLRRHPGAALGCRSFRSRSTWRWNKLPFWGTSASLACVSSVKANTGISSCLRLRTSKPKFPQNTESGCTQRARMQNTQPDMHTHSTPPHTHTQVHTTWVHAAVTSEGALFSHWISIYVNEALVCSNSQRCDTFWTGDAR